MSHQLSAQEINHGLEYLNQLGALYGMALLPEDLFPKVSLQKNSTSIVEDLGKMFTLVEQAIKAIRDYDALLQKGEGPVARSTETLKRLHKSLSSWTPISRWLRVLIAAERRWQQNLNMIAAAAPQQHEVVALLRDSSQEREELLQEVRGTLVSVHHLRNASYAIPVPL